MRVWYACAALLALAAAAQHVPVHVTSVHKGSVFLSMRDLEPNYIPDKQCSGYISNVKCPASATAAMSVQVWDAERFPDVQLNNSLSSATVYRRRTRGGACHGEAEVQVSVACEYVAHASQPPPRVARRAVRLPLPPAPPLY